MYYPLHVHTALGSIGDSILQIDDYVNRAKELGLPSLAITDHGSLAAMYSFMEACTKADIKPIIGMEAYEVANVEEKTKTSSHLVLLAKNDVGLQNLLQLHNDAHVRGFYYRPRVDRESLRRWGKGIIALSACVKGSVPQSVLEGNVEKCLELVSFYHSVFDEFYFELQPGTFEDQVTVNDTLAYLSQQLNIPVVITNDIHYLTAADAVTHDYHVKLGRKKDKKKISEEGMIYPDVCYWFMTEDDIKQTFNRTEYVTDDIIEQGLKNAALISESCKVTTDIKVQMPVVDDAEEKLSALCYDRLNRISQSKPKPQSYVDRLNRELSVISQKGFCSYFLVVHDYVTWAKEHDIKVGPGRGSAAGSLVAYLLGISAADPIKYSLIFERFLDPEREAIPDVDVDYEASGRDLVIKYLVDKYGRNNCAQIAAIHTRKAKASIKDAARILGYPVSLADVISKLIPTVAYDDDGNKESDLDITTSCSLVPELQKYRSLYPDIFDLAVSLEGLPSSSSTHAAGIVISPYDIRSTIPLVKGTNPDILATSLSLDDAEKLLVKFDLLSLNTLDVIHKVEQAAGVTFSYENNDFNDPNVWAVINQKYVAGVFQIASPTYKKRMWRLKPKNIEELAACLALLRGPCISTKLDEEYMLIKEEKKQVTKIHPIYDKVTAKTNGIILYQEQVMELAVGFGMTLSEGYRIVKASAKKKLDDLKQYRDKFVTSAQQRGCSTTTAGQIFDLIEKSSMYSFNKSHAVSYAMITYATAWLKSYYTDIFITVLLTDKFSNGKTAEFASLISDAKGIGYSFLPVDINKSSYEFTLEDGKIRMGFCSVRGLGDKAVKALLTARQALGTVEGLQQFVDTVEKKSFNKNKIILSVFAGLFDSFLGAGETRRDLYEFYCTLSSTEPQDEVSIAKDFVINTKSKAWKTQQKQLYGAVFFEKDEL